MGNSEDRVEFTKEMRKTYTILAPNMLDIHFRIIQRVFVNCGYNLEVLKNTDKSVVEEGLKYVHNDTCYPALLTIGQMISALKSGKYDVNKTAVMMTQTGGGCRASNYINLLRKALKNAGLGQVPVISLNVAGLERNSGFKLTLKMLRWALAAIAYGDLLMLLKNSIKPYEVHEGETEKLVQNWVEYISEKFNHNEAYRARELSEYFQKIVDSFDRIEIDKTPKVRVGIVGEIYVKYSALANNNLEKFLEEQDCEIVVPGLMGFIMYSSGNVINDISLYGGSKVKQKALRTVIKYLSRFEFQLIEALSGHERYIAPASYMELRRLAEPVIDCGCKMGEGWLLTAEMMELIEHNCVNIICTQPFGCLPNHIAGKGMMRKIREMKPEANIVAIDYDPGATKVNQENRIKLMLAVAREKLTSGADTANENGISAGEVRHAM